MKILICGAFKCVSHQLHSFVDDEDIIPELKQHYILNHYSYVKDYYIGLGLSELGNDVYFLYGDFNKTIINDNIVYLCNNDLNLELLQSFDYVFFMKHNPGMIEEFYSENKAFGQLNRTQKPWFVCKTCIAPKPKVDIQFDFYFLQTNQVKVSKTIIHRFVPDFNELNTIENVMKYTDRINDSPMYVYPFYSKSELCPFEKKSKYTLIYVGRLRQNYGMTLPFLMRMMSKLGDDYSLIIIPGSFNLPHQNPLVKYNASREKNLNRLKSYIGLRRIRFDDEYRLLQEYPDDYVCNEANTGNITIVDPQSWGDHLSYIDHCDVAINFSPNRTNGYQCEVANTKIFDYLVCGVPVISEAGCENNYMIEQYNAGIVIPHIGRLEEYMDGIKEIISRNYDKERISNEFKEKESYLERAKLINKVLLNNV